MKTMLHKFPLLAALLLTGFPAHAAAQGWVADVFPRAHAGNISRSANIEITFTQAIDPASLTKRRLRILGSQYGLYSNYQATYDNLARRVILNPEKDFVPGETVSVSLTSGIKNTAGDSLATPYVWSFRIQPTEGTAKFKPAINSGPGGWVYAFNTADFDGDGLSDLAVNVYSASILIFKNRAGGAFTPVQSISTTGSPECNAVGDFDNDGDVDIAVGLGESFRLWMNNGKGVFTLAAAAYLIRGHVYKIFPADLNGDGYLDLVIPGEWSNSIHIFLNKGNGSFNEDAAYAAGDHVREAVIGDFDNDGDLDMAANSIQTSSAILLNNGKGVFATQLIPGVQMVAMTTGDFNADGNLDFAAIMPGRINQPLAIFTNTGKATFTRTNYGPTSDVATIIRTADFDADGDLDLAYNTDYRITKIYYNTANGDFSGTASLLPAGGFNVLLPGDFNGDGSVDIVLSNGTPFLISTLLNRRKTPEIALRGAAINFGKVAAGNSKLFDLTVRNESGQTPLTVTIKLSAGSAFQALQSTLQIPPIDSAKVTFVFRPTNGVAYADNAVLNSNDPFSPTLTIPLQGVGVVKPAAPALLSPPNNAVKQPFPVTLRWDSLQTADSYHLQVYKNSLTGALIVDEAGIKTAAKTVANLLHKTGYVWRVAATNIAGEGDFSAIRTFSTFTLGPADLTAQKLSPQSVRIIWNRLREPDIIKYYLYGGVNAEALVKWDSTAAAADTALTINNIEQGRKYYFRVVATDNVYRLSDFSAPLEYVSPAFASPFSLNGARPAIWGDIDNDGDLDALTGGKIYRNDGAAFVEAWNGNIDPIDANSFGDFDGDGDLDILYKQGIFRNNGAAPGGRWSFTLITPQLLSEFPLFIDYDNDGDLDVYTSGANTSTVYRNDGRPVGSDGWSFTPIPIPNLYLGWKIAGDYDRDKRMDFLRDFSVWHNAGGGIFTLAFLDPASNIETPAAKLAAPAHLFNPCADWGDFDNDGNLDFCVIGAPFRIYRNAGAAGASQWKFTKFLIDSPPIYNGNGSLAPGDFDGDGDLDILFSINGESPGSILRNEGLQPEGKWKFTDTFTNFPASWLIGANWADYNNDGRLDAYICGTQGRLWRNILPDRNTPPTAPTALKAFVSKDTVTLSWKSATDAQQGRRLSYNIFIEDKNGRLIMPSHSNHQAGFRKIVGLGNAGLDTCWKVILPLGTYKWSVQAIDHSFTGSPFAIPGTFTITTSYVDDAKTELPKAYALSQNYPNPFNPATTLRYALPFRSHVRLRVFDALGNIVETLIDAETPAGFHAAVWRAKAATGIYFYRLEAVAKDHPSIRFEEIKKMVLIH